MNSYRTPKGSKSIVLDRDGVINQDSSTYIKSAEEWIPISGSIDAIARLHQANFRVITLQTNLDWQEDILTRQHYCMHDKMNHW